MKDYDVERSKLEGVNREFRLAGVTFACAPTMPAPALSDLADLQSGTRTGQAFALVSGVIRATLRPESREEWDALLARDDLEVPIDLATLLQVADDLVQAATGRPTQPPSPSSHTPATTPTRSTDGSGSPGEAESTTSRSVPA